MVEDTRKQHKQEAKTDGRTHSRGGKAPPLWEWCVAAAGLLLLLASLGFLVYQAFAERADVPAPVVQALEVQQQGNRYLLRLRVHNRTGATAAALRVVATLRRGSEVVERTEVEFDFLPGRSWRDGGVFFSRDPAQFQLELAAQGYRDP